jgi:RNA polymerase sigma factor (sigma-70 family)
LNVIEVVQVLKQSDPDIKPLLLSYDKDEMLIFHALKSGAKGYVTRHASVLDLVKAIKVVHRGEFWIERKLFASFFKNENQIDPSDEMAANSAADELTPRQREILSLLTKTGYSNKEIADALYISEKTVKCHLHSIFRKLNVTTRLDAIFQGIQLRL